MVKHYKKLPKDNNFQKPKKKRRKIQEDKIEK